jgi:hypothetical protein
MYECKGWKGDEDVGAYTEGDAQMQSKARAEA